MNLHSIRWRLPLSYIAIALVAALASGALMLAVLRGYYQEREREYLERNAAPIALAAGQLLEKGVPEKVIADQVIAWSFLLQTRVEVHAADGRLLADSGTPGAEHVLMVSHADPIGAQFENPILKGSQSYTATQALDGAPASPGIFVLPALPPEASGDVIMVEDCNAGEPCGPGLSVSTFITGTEPMTRPVTIAMQMGGSVYGIEMGSDMAIRSRRSSQRVEQPLHNAAGNIIGQIIVSGGPAFGAEVVSSVARAWAVASLIALAIAGAAGWWASRRMTAPVLHLTDVTARMAEGDLSARVSTTAPDEFGALGRSFDQMAVQIETLVGTLRQFIADAAHELNTPLAALQTDLDLARTTQGEEHTRLLERVSGQLTRLQALVRSLLDLSRLEGKASALVRQPVDLVELTQSLAEVYASRAEQAEINFALALPDQPAPIVGDPAQLNAAIGNLLDNAIKFTPPGGTVHLSLEKSGDQVSLSVEDTGIGIPPDDLPLLFRRFHRGRNASAYPGSGLGLAIVDRIIRLHGGSIQVENADPGSRFTICIPYQK